MREIPEKLAQPICHMILDRIGKQFDKLLVIFCLVKYKDMLIRPQRSHFMDIKKF